MLQDNNHIENNLRQLENQQLPDLSQMDAHWQQMQAVLTPGAAVSKQKSFLNSNLKKLLLAASIIGIALVIYFVNHKNNGALKNEFANGSKTEKVGTEEKEKYPVTQLGDSLKKQSNVIPATISISKHSISLKETNPVFDQEDSAISKVLVKPNLEKDVTTDAIDSKMSIDNFYSSIQKPAQQFIIDASAGADITAAEGTRIHIPPAAFIASTGQAVNGSVTIMIEEYYKYSDMIAANLTTTANNEQLVTGGMIKLTAVKNKQEVAIRNDKAINLSMPAKNYDPEMALFTGEAKNDQMQVITGGDTKVSSPFKRKVNWKLSGPGFYTVPFDRKTSFMNMENDPASVRGWDGRIGIFRISKESPYSVEEAKAILEEKYGDYYRKIKVKKVNENRRRFNPFKGKDSKTRSIKSVIGDSSLRFTVEEALRKGFIEKKDSAFYAAKVKLDSLNYEKAGYSKIIYQNTMGYNTSVMYMTRDTILGMESRRDYNLYSDSLQKIYDERFEAEQRYNFTIKNMGWINCDRFYKFNNQIDFVLNLPVGAPVDKLVTQIVFTSIRSVMPGQLSKNKISFSNIPANMKVYVVGLGERNGKVVSFIEKLKTSGDDVSITTLDETTPEAFKEKLKQLDL